MTLKPSETRSTVPGLSAEIGCMAYAAAFLLRDA